MSDERTTVPQVPAHRPLAVAHRAGNAPGAARAAFASGVDYVEADLHLHRSSVEVRHRKRVGRLAWLPIRWDRWELAFALREIGLPALLQAAEDAPDDAQLLLDLKGTNARLGAIILAGIEQSGFSRPYAVCARNWRLLEPFMGAPNVTVFHSAGNTREVDAAVSLLGGQECPGHISVDSRLLDQATVSRLRSVADTIITWHVDTLPHAEQVLAWGVDGVTTASATVLQSLVARRQPPPEA